MNPLLLTYTPPAQRVRVTHHEPKPEVSLHRNPPKRLRRFHSLMRIQMEFVDPSDLSAQAYSIYVQHDCGEVSVQEAAAAAIDRLTDIWLDKMFKDNPLPEGWEP